MVSGLDEQGQGQIGAQVGGWEASITTLTEGRMCGAFM